MFSLKSVRSESLLCLTGVFLTLFLLALPSAYAGGCKNCAAKFKCDDRSERHYVCAEGYREVGFSHNTCDNSGILKCVKDKR